MDNKNRGIDVNQAGTFEEGTGKNFQGERWQEGERLPLGASMPVPQGAKQAGGVEGYVEGAVEQRGGLLPATGHIAGEQGIGGAALQDCGDVGTTGDTPYHPK